MRSENSDWAMDALREMSRRTRGVRGNGGEPALTLLCALGEQGQPNNFNLHQLYALLKVMKQ